jgi:hypothetical protein
MKVSKNSKDPDILGALAALKRAARSAQVLAEATGTPLYGMKKGRMVNFNAKSHPRVRIAGRRRSGTST